VVGSDEAIKPIADDAGYFNEATSGEVILVYGSTRQRLCGGATIRELRENFCYLESEAWDPGRAKLACYVGMVKTDIVTDHNRIGHGHVPLLAAASH